MHACLLSPSIAFPSLALSLTFHHLLSCRRIRWPTAAVWRWGGCEPRSSLAPSPLTGTPFAPLPSAPRCWSARQTSRATSAPRASARAESVRAECLESQRPHSHCLYTHHPPSDCISCALLTVRRRGYFLLLTSDFPPTGEDFHFELLTPSGGKRRAVDRSHSLCCAAGGGGVGGVAAGQAASCACQQHQTVERVGGSGGECTPTIIPPASALVTSPPTWQSLGRRLSLVFQEEATKVDAAARRRLRNRTALARPLSLGGGSRRPRLREREDEFSREPTRAKVRTEAANITGT